MDPTCGRLKRSNPCRNSGSRHNAQNPHNDFFNSLVLHFSFSPFLQYNPYTLEQIEKQLNKLIDVIKVKNLTSTETVCRELALIKISGIGSDERKEILQFSEIYRSKIVDVAPDTVTVEITGTTDKIASFLALVEKMGKIEMVRTGTISIERGSKTIEV